MVCKLCGTDNPATNKFCGECGALLVKQAAAEPITKPPDREPDPEKIITIFEPLEPPIDQEFTEPIPEVKKPASEPRPAGTPSGFEPEGKHYTTISGPSFLGLTDDSPSEPDSTSYLLEEEPAARSHAGWYVFSFIAIALLAAIGVLEWRAIKTGKLSIPFVHDSTAATNPPEQPAVAQNQSTDQTANTEPQSASQAPWGNPQAKPDTDQSAPVARDDDKQATSDAQTRLAQQANDARSKAAATESSDQAAQSGSSSANQQTPTETTKTKEPSTSSSVPSEQRPKAERTASKTAERTPEKPDPKENQMLIAGEKYLYGRGVPRDCSQALIYFRAAAEQGNAPAMSHLGALYASGECTRQNRTMAYTWFRRAQNADPKNEWISKNMNMVWRDMTPQERASITQ